MPIAARLSGHLLAFFVAIALLPGAALADAGLTVAARSAPDDLIGATRTHLAIDADTLLDVARSNGLGYVEIVAANPGVDPWLPGEGTRVVLPTGHVLPDASREGIVINLGEQRLYYFPEGGGTPLTFPIGVGQEGWGTPLGRTEVVRKKANPRWYPTESIREENPDLPKVVEAGPDNPLGAYAIYLGWPTYLVHGTNKPWAVGRRVSHGCIRLYPENIEQLFRLVEAGTPVEVIDQPIKVGWSGGDLFVEAHPNRFQADELERTGKLGKHYESLADTLYRIRKTAGDASPRLDWRLIRETLAERTGLPMRVTRGLKVKAG